MKLFTRKKKGKTEEKAVPEQTDKMAKVKAALLKVSREAQQNFANYIIKSDSMRDFENAITVYTGSLAVAMKNRLPKPKKVKKAAKPKK